MAERKAVAPEIVHPPWCRTSICEVKPFEAGDVLTNIGNHKSGHWNRMTPHDGNHLLVEVAQFHNEPDIKVEMTLRTDEDSTYSVHMEPEEARQLARYLTEAAAEWERCRAVAGVGRG